MPQPLCPLFTSDIRPDAASCPPYPPPAASRDPGQGAGLQGKGSLKVFPKDFHLLPTWLSFCFYTVNSKRKVQTHEQLPIRKIWWSGEVSVPSPRGKDLLPSRHLSLPDNLKPSNNLPSLQGHLLFPFFILCLLPLWFFPPFTFP